MNTIYNRQNDYELLKIQAAARFYYDKADKLDLLYWFGILITIILKLLCQNNIFVDFLLILWFLFGFIFEYYIDKWTIIGAELKEDFDNYVMDIKATKTKIEEELIIEDIQANQEWFKQQINHDGEGEPKGVKNWYSVQKDMDQVKAIKLSYKENIFYDFKVNKILGYFFVLVFFISIIIFYFQGTSFTNLINIIFLTTASLTTKVINTIINLYKVHKLNIKIEYIIKHSDNLDELKSVQRHFLKKRKISGVSFGMIYNICKQRIGKKFRALFSESDN